MLAEKYAERIEKIFAKYPDKRSAIMPLLYIAQEEYGWLSEDALNEVAALCDVDPTQAHSIAGFYTMFRESPKGKYWLQVCTDFPCALRGADDFYQELCEYLEVEDGGTTEDGMFSLEVVRCFGACGLAPAISVDEDVHQRVKPSKVQNIIDQYRTMEAEAVSETRIR